MEDLRWCSTCLAMSTRPRITFDDAGRCNACVWAERKVQLDWAPRQLELENLLRDAKSTSEGAWDCVVAVSGGKDGSYVAHSLREKFGMRPLAVTVTPPLALEIGNTNLKNFADSGFDLLTINPNPKTMRLLNRHGFEQMGFPYYGWLIAIQAAVPGIAQQMGISLVFYAEDGEVEYGGSSATANSPVYGIEYIKNILLEGGYEKVIEASGLDRNSLGFFSVPASDEGLKTKILHWSYFESWDPYRNYLVAKEHCGLVEATDSNQGTFTNFAQNDQALYALHTYLMYLKFGFGRANQDACIEIRRGAMDREQGLNLVRLYDGFFPEQFLDLYLDYFEMSRNEFDSVLERWANPRLFERDSAGLWRPTFEVK